MKSRVLIIPEPNSVSGAVRRYLDLGFRVVPLRPGEKEPVQKGWTTRVQSPEGLLRLYRRWPHYGVGIVCGGPSGNLVDLDFDVEGAYERWIARYPQAERFLHQRTARGHHVAFRVSQPELWRSTTLLLDGEKVGEVLFEGTQFVAPPTQLDGAPNPRTWIVGPDEADLTPQAGGPADWGIEAPTRAVVLVPKPNGEHLGDRPGDRFDRLHPWQALLPGWTCVGIQDGVQRWRRPGKDRGHSATINWDGTDRLYVFSSNAPPFEARRAYRKFDVYTLLWHGGDYHAAAKALVALDYGRDGKPAALPPPPQAATAVSKAAAPAGRIRFVSAQELAARPPEPVRWLAEPFVAAGKLTLLAGPPGRGKSWLTLHLLGAIASGEPCFGRTTPGPTPVLLVDEELGEEELARRVQKLPQADLSGLHVLSRHGLCLSDARDAQELLAACREAGIGCVALDSYRRLLRGDEADSENANRFYTNLVPFLQAGIGVLLIHHVRKRGLVYVPGEAQRGSGDLVAQADVYIEGSAKADTMKLSWEKLRFGEAPGPVLLHVLDTESGKVEVALGAVEADEVRQKLAQQVLAIVSNTPGLSQRELCATLGVGNRKLVRAACQDLVDAGRLELRTGEGRALLAFPVAVE